MQDIEIKDTNEVLSFPDDMPQDQIKSAIDKYLSSKSQNTSPQSTSSSVLSSIGDGIKRLGKNVVKGSFEAAAGVNDTLAGLSKLQEKIDPVNYVIPHAKEGTQQITNLFQQLASGARDNAQKYTPQNENLFDQIQSGAVSMGLQLPKYALAGTLGPIGFGGLGALDAAGQNQSGLGIAKSALSNAILGKVYETVAPLKLTNRMPILGLAGAALDKANNPSASLNDLGKSFVSNAVLGGLGSVKGKSITDLYKTPEVMPDSGTNYNQIGVYNNPRVKEYIPNSNPIAQFSETPKIEPYQIKTLIGPKQTQTIIQMTDVPYSVKAETQKTKTTQQGKPNRIYNNVIKPQYYSTDISYQDVQNGIGPAVNRPIKVFSKGVIEKTEIPYPDFYRAIPDNTSAISFSIPKVQDGKTIEPLIKNPIDAVAFEKKVSDFAFGKDKNPIIQKVGNGGGPGSFEQFTDKLTESLNQKLSNAQTNGMGWINLFSNRAGKTASEKLAADQLRGGRNYTKETAIAFKDNINLGLKPEDKVTLSEVLRGEKAPDVLPQNLKDKYQTIRDFNDGIHQVNYGANGILATQLKKRLENGDITQEQFNTQFHKINEIYKNRETNYYGDLYKLYEIGPQATKSRTDRLDTGMYKAKKEIDASWKQENIINDPGYVTAKRYMQTMMNNEFMKYADWVRSNPDFVSKVEKPGFTKLPDSPTYGTLADLWVRKDKVDDILGFSFENDNLNKAYDLLDVYGKAGSFVKSGKTVLNPGVRVGNRVGNKVFAFVNGMPELSVPFNKYTRYGVEQIKSKGEAWRTLQKEGLLGTDFTRDKFTSGLGDIQPSNGIKAKIGDVYSKLKESYGSVDDSYKIGAYKLLVENGYTPEQAVFKIKKSFQDYSNVAPIFDIYSKTPVIGKSFVKFTPEMARILTNGVKANPLWATSLLGVLYGASKLGSNLSKETDEQRVIRESDPRSSKIFGIIPTTIMTPWGEIDLRRWIGVNQLTMVNDKKNTGNILSGLGVPDNLNPLDLSGDVLGSPVVDLAMNKNWIGKKIFDPNVQTSTQQIGSVGRYLSNAYLPTVASPDYLNKAKAAFTDANGNGLNLNPLQPGAPDQYGKTRTPAQMVAENALGLRFRQMNESDLKDIEKMNVTNLSKDLEDRKQSLIDVIYRKDLTPDQKQKYLNQAVDIVANKYKNSPKEQQDLAVSTIKEFGNSLQNSQNAKQVFETIKDKPLSEQYKAWGDLYKQDQKSADVLLNIIKQKSKGYSDFESVVAKQNGEVKARYVYEQAKVITDPNAQNEFIRQMLVKGILNKSNYLDFINLMRGK